MDTYRFPRQAYLLLEDLDSQGKTNWASKVRRTLQTLGFGFVWLNQGVANEKMFLSVFKQRAIDVVRQEWSATMRDSDRYCLYRKFKSVLEPEKYLTDVNVKCFRDTLGRFRLGVSEIQTHRNRFVRQIPPGINDCPYCPGKVEDEKHVLFACPKYDAFRPQPLKNVLPYHQDSRLVELLSCKLQNHNRQLSWFLFKCFDQRKESV